MGDSVTPEGRDLTEGLKLAAVAVVSAALTAMLVIGAGRIVLRPSSSPSASASQAASAEFVISAGG